MTNDEAPSDSTRAWSHDGGNQHGLLGLHHIAGSPAILRPLAERFVSVGYDVELPLLPGHGTSVDDLTSFGWSDWTTEVEEALTSLTARVESVVVLGLSMGGTLALWSALNHGDVAGVVCINPATVPASDDVLDQLRAAAAEGIAVLPADGDRPDVADPSVTLPDYTGTAIAPMLSLVEDGLRPLTHRFGELTMPLRLFTSRQDHSVPPSDSDHLADAYGGRVERTWLENSYHLAPVDFDKDLVASETLAFARAVVSP